MKLFIMLIIIYWLFGPTTALGAGAAWCVFYVFAVHDAVKHDTQYERREPRL